MSSQGSSHLQEVPTTPLVCPSLRRLRNVLLVPETIHSPRTNSQIRRTEITIEREQAVPRISQSPLLESNIGFMTCDSSESSSQDSDTGSTTNDTGNQLASAGSKIPTLHPAVSFNNSLEDQWVPRTPQTQTSQSSSSSRARDPGSEAPSRTELQSRRIAELKSANNTFLVQLQLSPPAGPAALMSSRAEVQSRRVAEFRSSNTTLLLNFQLSFLTGLVARAPAIPEIESSGAEESHIF